MSEDHQLVMFDNSKDLGNWYNQKYTEMGGGWKCGPEESKRLLDWAGIPRDTSKVLLDIGCGDGDFLITASEYATCYGIDLSEVGIDYAKITNPHVTLRVSDIEETTFPSYMFNYLTSIGSIEHVINMDKALKECRRILAIDGLFLCMVPNEGWKYLDQPQEQTHTDEEWTQIFERNGFVVEKMVRRNDLTDFLLSKTSR